jgi:RNA polymerase sigma-70 factor (ECF subfamily)
VAGPGVGRWSQVCTVEGSRTHRDDQQIEEEIPERGPVTVTEDFETETTRYRRELLAACYQMLGSVHEAEDVVQETMLRAWRARDRYDASKASMRTWLHRIAANACLNALESKRRRPLPSNLVGSSTDPEQALVPAFDVPWLQPVPTALFLDGEADDPATRLVRTGQLRLAFAAALQLLPPRQRAVLILREVLQFSAAEVAEMIEATVPATNSLLQRARQRLADHADLEAAAAGASPEDEAVVERFTAAFLRGDVAELTALLAADAILEMPPVPLWYRGSELYGRFMARVYRDRGTDFLVERVSANGQPALVVRLRDGDTYRLHTLQVLSVAGGRITRNVVFQDPAVFALFGLAEQSYAGNV